MCGCVCVGVCGGVWVCGCVCVCVRVSECVFAIYDNNNYIIKYNIIKIIILYFTQITHTDDSPQRVPG